MAVNPLSLVRWDRLELGHELSMRFHIHRPVLHRGTCRIFPREVVTIPIRRRSDRPRSEPAATVRADISQNLFDTGYAERALIRADPRLKRLRRQRPVAMFACRPDFKHRASRCDTAYNGQSMVPGPFFEIRPAKMQKEQFPLLLSVLTTESLPTRPWRLDVTVN